MAEQAHFDRLTAIDSMFLDLEDGANHMHVAAVLLFEGGPLRAPDGRADVARLRRYTEWALASLPRWRQRLARVPLLRDPVWVDAPQVHLDRHIRRLGLPPPGDDATLRAHVGALLSQELDRDRPLWELWLVDGMADGRIALVAKVHHAMVDGIAGIGLMATLLRPTPDDTIPDANLPPPRPVPSGADLLRADLARRVAAPKRLWRDAQRLLRTDRNGHRNGGPGIPREHDGDRNGDPPDRRAPLEDASGAAELARAGLRPTSRTALNPPHTGPNRSFAWTRHDLARVKAIRHAAGATVNDVVLAIVAGGVRRFLRDQGERVDHLRFRVAVPVGLPREGTWGNKVSILLAPLPVDEPSPKKRLRRVHDTMQHLKATGETKALFAAEHLADLTAPSAMGLAVKAAIRLRPYNLIVTNVKGPQVPLYLLGARMLDSFPVVPLYGNQAAGLAILSYDGTLCWGVNADADRLPELESLVGQLDQELECLADAWLA